MRRVAQLVLLAVAFTVSAPKALAQACPVKTQTCYPGCATVDGAMVCGTALLLTAGSMKAAIELMAKSDGISVDEFCNRFGTLCAAAKSGPKGRSPRRSRMTRTASLPELAVLPTPEKG